MKKALGETQTPRLL